jgi:hypothetical protein
VSGRARGDRRSNRWHTGRREQCYESGPCSAAAHAVSEALDALLRAGAEGFRRCRNPQLSAWASIRSLTNEADEL